MVGNIAIVFRNPLIEIPLGKQRKIMHLKTMPTHLPTGRVDNIRKNEGRTHPAKTDLNKKWLLKQKTIQNCNIDAQGFRKPRNENLPTQEIGSTS